jgi:hypothetical protein
VGVCPAYQSACPGEANKDARTARWTIPLRTHVVLCAAARTDRGTACRLLVLLTLGCRTRDRFDQERVFLFGVGVPAGFLPGAVELGRVGLV